MEYKQEQQKLVKFREQFLQTGFCEMPGVFDKTCARDLLHSIRSLMPFDEGLFFSEAQWEASSKSHRHTNPGPGYNVLETVANKLDFIENNEEFRRYASELLGKDFQILRKKAVCRIPQNIIPDWLQKKIAGRPTNTFNAFMHPQFRTISYFYENDLHQDILEWSRWMPREHRIVTMYVYLDDVTVDDAPVVLMPRSHTLGATPYQHQITQKADGQLWRYERSDGRFIEEPLTQITGEAGHSSFWHGLTIHAAPPIANGRLRISLRYVLGRSLDDTSLCAIDALESQIDGPLYLEEDYSAGANANDAGMWTLQHTDFTRMGRRRLQGGI